MELKVDSERVKAAAKGCPDVKRALEVLFPEVFAEDASPYVTMEIEGKPTATSLHDGRLLVGGRALAIQIRSGSDKAVNQHGLYLSDSFRWEIVMDKTGQTVLVAQRR